MYKHLKRVMGAIKIIFMAHERSDHYEIRALCPYVHLKIHVQNIW